jgi:light-regulated signal transduction histidine kinase (bacteriophytochrome)
MKEGRLWGLISATHISGPKYIPYPVRTACEFVGEFMSSFIPAKEGDEDHDQRIRARSVQARLLERMTRNLDFAEGLCHPPPELLELTGASGAAVYFNGATTIVGKAPSDEQLQALIRWLGERPDSQEVFCTHCLSREYPEAEAFEDVAAGLIAASMSRGRHNYVLWFRPEVVQTVEWGGNPHKPVDMGAAQPRLHPRKSFALWQETVRGRSLPWKDYEAETAPRPGLILLDLNLAGLDGRQVLEHLKGDAHLRSIPVIVFSTSDNPKDVQSAYAHGASGYLLKPVDLSRFERMIQLFKDFWLDHIVLPEGDGREGARR